MSEPRKDEAAIRKADEKRQTNCMNCYWFMTSGRDVCPRRNAKVSAEDICDDYKPGLM